MYKQKAINIITCCIVAPITKISNNIESYAAARNASRTGDLAREIAHHNANGTDLAALKTSTIFADQTKLITYRLERVFVEGKYIASGQYFHNYTYKHFIIDLRFFTKLLAIYIAAVCVGRFSVYPLIRPESPYALGLEYKRNPNM
eukprot:Tbor_TRINITY_DN5356_c2_g1::TRINITY_DN5356_c2_g1_i1::g.4284::m.4284